MEMRGEKNSTGYNYNHTISSTTISFKQPIKDVHIIRLLSGIQGSVLSSFSLQQVAPKIKAMMMESGTTMVGYQPQGNKVNFFRMVVSNPSVTQSDIDFLIDEIERLAHDL